MLDNINSTTLNLSLNNIFTNSELLPFWSNLYSDLKNDTIYKIKHQKNLNKYLFNISRRVYKLLTYNNKFYFFILYNLPNNDDNNDNNDNNNLSKIKIIIDSLSEYQINSDYIRCFICAYITCFLEVKNIKDKSFLINDINHLHLYIGRYNRYKNLQASCLYNPYKISSTCSREQSILKYKHYITKEIFINKNVNIISEINDILKNISNQKFVYLLCWCQPLPCHGSVILDVCHYLLLLNYKSFILNLLLL